MCDTSSVSNFARLRPYRQVCDSVTSFSMLLPCKTPWPEPQLAVQHFAHSPAVV